VRSSSLFVDKGIEDAEGCGTDLDRVPGRRSRLFCNPGVELTFKNSSTSSSLPGRAFNNANIANRSMYRSSNVVFVPRGMTRTASLGYMNIPLHGKKYKSKKMRATDRPVARW
jgi:hypothetical protein